MTSKSKYLLCTHLLNINTHFICVDYEVESKTTLLGTISIIYQHRAERCYGMLLGKTAQHFMII